MSRTTITMLSSRIIPHIPDDKHFWGFDLHEIPDQIREIALQWCLLASPEDQKRSEKESETGKCSLTLLLGLLAPRGYQVLPRHEHTWKLKRDLREHRDVRARDMRSLLKGY